MLLDLLRKRRSIRKFTGQAVEEEKIELLLEAALLSPSSKGNTPWHFVVVCDQDCISKLALAKPHGASVLINAPLVIAVCGDSNRSDVWVEDCSIATLLLHLQATDLGLGSCWVQLRLRAHDDNQSAAVYTAELLGLPAHIQPLALVGIGYPAETKKVRTKEDLRFAQISSERLGQVWPSK